MTNIDSIKCIDFRVRPPYGSFKDNFLFSEEYLTKYSNQYGFDNPKSAVNRSMELLLSEMDKSNVEKAVVPLRKFGGSLDNADLANMMQEYPGRFVGLAGIDPLDKDALQDIDDYVVNGPCYGVNMEPGLCNPAMVANDTNIYSIYEKCQSNHVPVVLSYGGFCHETLQLNNPEHIDQLAVDFPDLTIIVIHGGWPHVAAMCSVALNRPNVYLSADCYLIRTPGYQDYITAANYFLKNKLIFGSAYPLLPICDAVNFYLNCGIREEVLPNIMYNNAAKALSLDNK